MSDAGDPDVTRLLRDLTRELQTLQRELDDSGRRGLPSGSQLSRFTSEVAIPGVILLLETNIRALQLLRRTIRLADGRDPRDTPSSTARDVRDRAEQLGQATLVQLDNLLAEVQESLDEREGTDEANQLLEDARQLQSRIREQLARSEAESTSIDIGDDETDPVDIDVDAELQSLKDNLEDDGTNSDGANDNSGEGGAGDGNGTDRAGTDGDADDGGNS